MEYVDGGESSEIYAAIMEMSCGVVSIISAPRVNKLTFSYDGTVNVLDEVTFNKR